MPVTARSGNRGSDPLPDTFPQVVVQLADSEPAVSRWAKICRTVRKVRSARPRTLWLNAILIVVLVAAIVAAFLVIGNPDTVQPTGRTVTVSLGNVSASVTGSGNAASSVSTNVNFATNGTVTSIKVKPGDKVKSGQVLATIDPTTAQQTLRTAQATLASAQASYQQAVAGPTAVQKQKDQLAITQAKASVTTAQNGITNAQTQLGLDTTSLATAVNNAHQLLASDTAAQNIAVNNSHQQLTNDTTVQGTLVVNARTKRDAACSVTPTPSATPSTTVDPCTQAQQDLNVAEQNQNTVMMKDQQAVTTAEAAKDAVIRKDQQAITTAQQNQSSTLAKDKQAITAGRQQLVLAQGQVTSAALAATADLTPSTPAQIAQARATVTSATVQVEQARLALANTQLTAIQEGTVLAVNGKVGQSSASTSSSSSSTSSGSSGSGSGGSSSGSNSSGSSSSGSGFVVLANVSRLAVTANIAEADVTNIKLGQITTVTFSATSSRAQGTVTEISPQSTVSNNVVLYPVTVSLATAPAGVKVGATASISIQTGSAKNVLVVPSSAITTLGTRHTVTVRRNGADTMVEVQVGMVGDAGTEVTSGLSEGDTVVFPTATPGAGTGSGTGGGSRMGGAGGFGAGGAGR